MFSESLKVTLSHGGGVYGRYTTSRSGRGIRAFRGIPYAEPPIGNLRFSDPVEKEKWTGFIDGDKNRVSCTQIDVYVGDTEVQGQEDCLYLNVYVPNSVKSGSLLPVLVYIHGGGYIVGDTKKLEPDYLLDHDIILVTGNYRLGALGFLSNGTKELPGNYGLKDQVLMLKWVQDNITNFGGDPKRVTISGNSAGASSVSLHLVSPLSKGLFQQAILHSGNYCDPWAIKDSNIAYKNAEKLFEFLNCPDPKTNPSEALNCLKSKTDKEIVQQLLKYIKWGEPTIVFAPVIENEESANPFITQKNLDDGPDPNIPIIIGMTANEGAMKLAALHTTPEKIKAIESNFNKTLPLFMYFNHLEESEKLKGSEKAISFYLKNKTFVWETDHLVLNNLMTDANHLNGLNKFLTKRFSKGSTSNTFVYLLDYRGEASFTDLTQGIREDAVDYGVSHCDELIYLFPITEKIINFRHPTEMDERFRKTFVETFVGFVNSGAPSNSGEFKWTSSTKFPIDYLRMGTHNLTDPSLSPNLIKMEHGFFPERSEFWKNIHQ